MSGPRFNPPELALPDSAAEVLRLAFAEPPPAGADPGETDFEIAERLGLSARIGQRLQGAGADRPRQAAAWRAAAGALRYEELARRIATVADGVGVPLIFLKGFALHLRGDQQLGQRAFADLDLLAPAQGARALQEKLIEGGFEPLDQAANEHHLPALSAPDGGVVEIHFRLRGVRVADQPWATADEILADTAVEPAEGLEGECWLPGRDLLAAHLLVHGLEQHGQRPETYPLLWMVGDLVDLFPEPALWEAFRRDGYPFVADSVAPAELAAVEQLCHCLVAGRLPDAEAEPGAELLLRHVVAAALDESYRRSLKLVHVAARLGGASRSGGRLAYLRRKLLPARESVPEGRARRLLRLSGQLLGALIYRLRPRRRGQGAGEDPPSATMGGHDPST